MKLYAVVTLAHNGGHGPWPVIIEITADLIAATQTARNMQADAMGFEINWREDGVSVMSFHDGKEYNREDYRDSRGGHRTHYTLRQKLGSEQFEEYFWDASLARSFAMTIATSNLPSQHRPDLSPIPPR